jgi:hypothetical protein
MGAHKISSSATRKAVSAKSTHKKFWSFLNSPLGLLLISSALLTGMARLYTDFQSFKDTSRIQQQEIAKLISEFDYRLSLVEYYSRELAGDAPDREARVSIGVQIWRAVTGDVQFQPALPEYKNAHWLSIAVRLRVLLADSTSDEIAKIIFDIESEKGSDWLYDPNKLDRQTKLLRAYVQRVKSTIY